MPIFVKGDRVRLQVAKDGSICVLAQDIFLIHDTEGKHLKSCSAYLMKVGAPVFMDEKKRSEARQVTASYYGKSARLQQKALALPRGPWKRVALIDAIWYRRRGKERGNYVHPYAFAVPLYESADGSALRLSLPSGCVWNERGFVWP